MPSMEGGTVKLVFTLQFTQLTLSLVQLPLSMSGYYGYWIVHFTNNMVYIDLVNVCCVSPQL